MAEAVKSAAMRAGTATTTVLAERYVLREVVIDAVSSHLANKLRGIPRRRSPIELLSQIEQFLSSVHEHCI
jgi:hypothetical protein